MSCGASSANKERKWHPGYSAGVFFTFMRDYIPKHIREHIPRLVELASSAVTLAMARRGFRFNSITGTVNTTEGVENNYIYGDVEIGKDALLLNSVVNEKVTLQIGSGAKVINCVFRPIMMHNAAIPCKVVIGAGTVLQDTILFGDTCIGNNCHILYMESPKSKDMPKVREDHSLLTIGDNSFVVGCTLQTGDYYASLQHSGDLTNAICIGNNAILIKCILRAGGHDLCFGDNLVVCDVEDALKICCGSYGVVNEYLVDDAAGFDVYRVTQHIEALTDLCALPALHAGNDCYIGTSISLVGAFDHTTAHCTWGHGVYLVPSEARRVSGYTFVAHSLVVGDNTTLLKDSDLWSERGEPYKDITIGSNALVKIGRHDNCPCALDVNVPDNALTVI